MFTQHLMSQATTDEAFWFSEPIVWSFSAGTTGVDVDAVVWTTGLYFFIFFTLLQPTASLFRPVARLDQQFRDHDIGRDDARAMGRDSDAERGHLRHRAAGAHQRAHPRALLCTVRLGAVGLLFKWPLKCILGRPLIRGMPGNLRASTWTMCRFFSRSSR